MKKILIFCTALALANCSSDKQTAPLPPSPSSTPKQEEADRPGLVLELDESKKKAILEPEALNLRKESALVPKQEGSVGISDTLQRVEIGLEEETPVFGYKFQKKSKPSSVPDIQQTPDLESSSGSIKDGKISFD